MHHIGCKAQAASRFQLADKQRHAVMLHDAALAARFAEAMLKQGVYVVAFSFPVVPRGKARIRTQMSAALSDDDIAFALDAFANAKREVLA